MSDSTRSGNVGHERAARAPELVVEADAGRKGEKARRHPGAQVLEGPGAVALEAQQVLEGLEDGLDPLADPAKADRALGLVGPGRAHDERPRARDGGLEL